MLGENSMGSTLNRLKIVDGRLICSQHILLWRAYRKVASTCTIRTAVSSEEVRPSPSQRGDLSDALIAEEPPWTTASIAAIQFAERITLAGVGIVDRSLALTATASAGSTTQPG